ncbi:hypothetical protein [Thioalkalicoccus limnaeus]|uniref:hypothetical protein n=1 Tax=Thioalkalicoccus limnaeus TaxID=120681 RepID=UPI003F7423E0
MVQYGEEVLVRLSVDPDQRLIEQRLLGVPARQIGWMSRHGERLDLPLTGSADATCPATGHTYRLKNGTIDT